MNFCLTYIICSILGFIFLLFATGFEIKILTKIKNLKIKKYYYILTVLTAFFSVGYLLNVFLVLCGYYEMNQIIIGFVYFFGSIFALISIYLFNNFNRDLIKNNLFLEKKIENIAYDLNSSTKDFRSIIENVIIGIGIFQDEYIVYANKTFLNLIKYPMQEIKKYSIINLLDKLDYEKSSQIKKQFESFLAKQTNNYKIPNYKIITHKNQIKWVDLFFRKINFNGSPAIFIGMIDRTEKNRVLNKLLVSEEKYRNLFEKMTSGVAIYEVKDNGNKFIIKDFNSMAEKIENIKREDIIGKDVTKVFPGIKEFGLLDVFKRVWKTGKSENYPINLYKDNRMRASWRENFVYKLSTGEIVAVYNDITEKKEAESKLQKSELYLRDILETAPVAIIEVDLVNSQISYINPEMSKLTGYSFEELYKMDSFIKLIYSEDRKKLFETVSEKEGKNSSDRCSERIIEFRLINKDGNIKWVYGKKIDKFQNGKKVKARVWLQDITSVKIIQQQLKESREKYRLITENANDLIAIYNEKWEHEFINSQVYYKLTGYTKDEIIGQPPIKFIHPDDYNTLKKATDEFRKTGIWKTQLRFRKKSGEYRWLESSGRKFIDSDGKEKLIVISRDVTERIEAEQKLHLYEQSLKESEEKFKSISNSAADAIITIDHNGLINFWNPVAERIFGYSADEIYRKDLHKILAPPKSYKKFKEMFKKFVESGEGRVFGRPLELVAIKKDGNSIPVELSVSKLKIKGKWAAIGIIRDITERKIAEKERNQLLEQIRAQNEELKKIDQLKDEFFADAAHEFRTPLIAIKGFSELLLKSKNISNEEKEDIKTIYRNAKKLENLINEILNYYKLKANVILLKNNRFRVSTIINILKKDFKVELEKKNLCIKDIYLPDIEVVFDQEQILRLLRNLISNAIKFSNDNSEIEIISKIDDDNWTCSVIDYGIGIKKSDIPKLFSRFGKLEESRALNKKGMGLGLTICYKIVDLYKGKIWVESDGIGKGTKFIFRLPLKKAPLLIAR
ncbi:MAG: PAS domain S-box protein [Candidatus Helarchaeota archaeon]